MNKEKIQFYVTSEEKKKLKEEANEKGFTLTGYINNIIRSWKEKK